MEDQGWLQLVTPKVLREEILREIHEGIAGGHLEQALCWLKERFYWPGHYNDVRKIGAKHVQLVLPESHQHIPQGLHWGQLQQAIQPK